MQSFTSRDRSWRSLGGPALALGVTAFGWYRWHTRWSLSLFVLATLVFVLALALPRTWRPIQAVLGRLAHGGMAAITWLLLGVVFAACFIPGRLILALWRRDPLHRAREPARNSYWEPLPRPGAMGRFRRQF